MFHWSIPAITQGPNPRNLSSLTLKEQEARRKDERRNRRHSADMAPDGISVRASAAGISGRLHSTIHWRTVRVSPDLQMMVPRSPDLAGSMVTGSFIVSSEVTGHCRVHGHRTPSRLGRNTRWFVLQLDSTKARLTMHP
jgi:hypothetical protein